MEKKGISISILGCGWLGKPLALHLQAKGYDITGSRTTEEGVKELAHLGIKAMQVVMNEEQLEAPAAFWQADILIVNVPPRIQRGAEAYIAETRLLCTQIRSARIKKVIFVSSTSVYPNINDRVTEECADPPESANGEALLAAEKLLCGMRGIKTTVLRFGGLSGYDRIPVEKSRNKLPQYVPVNVIHRDDCIGIIERVIEKDVWGEIFNACASGHPLRYYYLQAAAEARGLPKPRRKPLGDEESYKIVTNVKLKKILEYKFLYDDPLKFF
ncbi:SDR family oxidoreductase [Chitinophaga vietnamensis]|uniref:SDR family oxidoreductase n=1 Tax=Chitinophaga vietnamensis TaxID=2593957 RepID=UPI00117808C6|nr:SDR family oxidoreductase [Chitinophaga vietnamensis]